MNENLVNFGKKLPYFFGSFLSIIGGVSALGMALASKEFVVALGVCCVFAAAIPTLKHWIEKILD